jgi:hypothetical protein
MMNENDENVKRHITDVTYESWREDALMAMWCAGSVTNGFDEPVCAMGLWAYEFVPGIVAMCNGLDILFAEERAWIDMG